MAEEIVIKTVLDLSGSEQVIKRQVEKALAGRESAEDRHNRRIEALHLQSATRIQQIETRKQAQIDLIRERALQKELEHQRKIERETQRAANAFGSMRTAIAGVAGIFTVLATSGAVRFFEDLARRAIDAAVAIDRQVNTLKALTGSAEAATRRFSELFALAQKTPGLTTNLALTLDTQLRVLDVTEKTINRILPSIGRLNAIAPLNDPSRFVGNLVQLITQNFEKQDLRELVGNSPFAGQLIKEIFNVDSPTNAKAIRESAQRLGINTVEEFFTAISTAAENNPKLQRVTESLATQFEKLQDRITVALAPIGDELLKTILPAFRELVELLERDAPKISALLRDNREELIAVASAFVTAASAVGTLIGQLGKLNQNLGVVRTLSVLALAITAGPSAAVTAGRAFFEADRRQASLQSKLPFGVSIEETLGAIRDPVTGRISGGGVGLGSGEAAAKSQAQKEREREIKDLTKKIADERDKFMQGVVEDLEGIERIITGANLENVRREGERPRQLRSFGTALADRIRNTELETLRLEENTRRANADTIGRTGRRAFNRSGAFIEDAFNRGQITAGEAEQLRQGASRELANQLRLKEQLLAINDPLLDDLREEIELYDRLGTAISDTERFARGFNSAIESSGDIWERFGQNVSNAFRNVKDLFNGLKQAVLGFFNDLLGNSIQNLVRSTLGPLFSGSGLGNLFRTPSFAGGGGISAPQSISGVGSILSGLFNRGGGGGAAGGVGDFIGSSVPRTAGSIATSAVSGFSFGNIASSVSSILPLIGTQLGAGLGGQSVPGQLLGAAGGSGLLGAILGPFALVGAALLGGGKQRRADEQAAGDLLTAAQQAIQQLASGIASDQIDGSQARSIFDRDILGQFKSGIGQLKTKSVRESRLTNQVRDLEKVYNDVVPPQIAAQQQRRTNQTRFAENDRRTIPEFERGGTTRGGIALLHPGEKVLNLQQQASVIRQSNPRVFDNAGVPGPSQNRIFDIGGTMSGSGGAAVVIENLNVSLLVGKDDQTRIVVNGGSTTQGRQVTVKNVTTARRNGEL